MSTYPFVSLIAVLLAWLTWLLFRRREKLRMDDNARRGAPGNFVRLTDGVTHYTIRGPETGETIVCVPGATLALWVWGDLPPQLARAGYRVVTYDLLGRGYSDRPRRAYDMDFHVGQLHELVGALKLRTPVTLVGLAFGCLIAGEFANRYPDRVQRVVLLGPDGFGVVMRGLGKLLHQPLIGPMLFTLLGDKTMIARLGTYAKDQAAVAWLRERLAPDLKYKGFKRAVVLSVRNMPIHDAKKQIYARTNAQTQALMLIWGRDDRVCPMPDESMVRRIFSNARLYFLDETGHLPHVERPEQTLRLLLDFLRTESTTARVS